MIFQTDPDNPVQLSGMPHRMAEALREQGVEIAPLRAVDPDPARSPAARLRSRAARHARDLAPGPLRAGLARVFASRIRAETLGRATAMSARVRARLYADGLEPTLDLLFGVCISSPLFDLRTTLPVLYFSDATAPILHASYPRAAARSDARRDALEFIERTALARATRAVFASPQARDSAVNDLGVPAERTGVIPMGAHITPPDPARIHAPAAARDCRLLIVAADPVRKRVDLAVRATEALRARGITARLTVIGPGTPLARRSAFVECVGPLRIANPDCAQRHREALRACHVQLLPSVGEAFGIAPAESAHYARPSIVSDAGGLPSVVHHDRTGLVLPVTADHRAWADAIAGLVQDPDRYRRYSAGALARARSELNWSAWAASTVRVMRDLAGSAAAAEPATPARRTG